MSRIRIIFFGTPEFAVASLKALLEDEHYEVVGVVSQPDRRAGRKMQLTPSPVKALALQHQIPVLTPEDVNTPEASSQIAAWAGEVAVVVAFGQLLKKPLLQMFPARIVNVHASLLPRWRGAAPIQRSIMAGDHETGVSLQVMVRKLDAGDVLGERKVPISEHLRASELHDQLARLGGDLLKIELMDYIRGNLFAVKQDESLVTYAKKIEKSEGEINWNCSAREIHNQVRGLDMGPGTWTHRQGKTLKVIRTEVADEALQMSPGMVYRVNHEELIVTCGQGLLKILEVQPESRDKMPVKAYLRGYPVTLGEKFD